MSHVLVLGGAGYIGSRLVDSLRNDGYNVSTVDLCLYGGQADYVVDYNKLSAGVISEFDVVILLAAHPSVQTCEADPEGSWKNNVDNFRGLLGKLRKDQLLIYASSGSLLQGNTKNFGEDQPFHSPLNNYDMQKQVIEMLAQRSDKYTIGLRFGTVCGYSYNPRLELMVNSMYMDAKATGTINISNKNKHRAILGLGDLTKALKAILSHPAPPGGIYNLCSFDRSIGQIAEGIGDYKIIEGPDSKTYDFNMFINKFKSTFDWQPEETIQSICAELDLIPEHKRDKSKYNRSTNLFKYEVS